MTKVPSQEDLKPLHRWARVALVARAVRRVQPLYQFGWPKAPAKFLKAIEAAIAEGELAAAQGAPTPNLNRAAYAAMDVYGEAPDELLQTADYIWDVPFAAARVSFAGRESDGLFAVEGLEQSLEVVYYWQRATKTRGLKDRCSQLIWNDLRALEAAAKAGKWKKNTPVTSEICGPLWPDGPPKGWPAMPLAKQPAKTKPTKKAAGSGPKLSDLHLPKDLVAFFKAGQKLKFNASKSEVGPIVLHPLDHLTISTFDVLTEDTPAHANDPNRNKSGHYVVRAVDLVAECDAYGPEGILAWLPDDKMFATYDTDHAHVIVFPKATWTDIVKSPAKFLDAQWGDFDGFGRHIEPWKHGKFVKK
jgi:hypothetical protein